MNGTRGPCKEGGKTPKCVKTCEDGYKIPYDKDLHRGKCSNLLKYYLNTRLY